MQISGSSSWHLEADGSRTTRLLPRERGRFSSAAFLMVWLAFWALGEAVVAVLLVAGVVAFVTGRPFASGGAPLELGPAVAAGSFMVLWLTFWTFGGAMAIRELLRLVWSEDRVVATPGGLIVVHRLGPVRSRRELPRDEVRRIYVSGEGALRAETGTGTVELSSLGTAEERLELAARLRAALGVVEQGGETPPTATPKGWQEIVLGDGAVALVPDLRTRRLQARIAAGIAAVAGGVALVLAVETLRDRDLAVVAIMAVAAAFGLGWLALRLTLRRDEWVYGSGRLTLRRRVGTRVRTLFSGTALELTVSHDSDGDPWYELEALAPGRAGARRRITRSVHDASEPRRLALWLAERSGVRYHDRTKDRVPPRN